MPTEKPRFTITVSEELLEQIENYRFENRCRSQTDAVLQLMQKGLDALMDAESIAEQKEPASPEGLTDDERQFIDGFKTLSPSNRRLLLGIAALLLQEQARPDDSRN